MVSWAGFFVGFEICCWLGGEYVYTYRSDHWYSGLDTGFWSLLVMVSWAGLVGLDWVEWNWFGFG